MQGRNPDRLAAADQLLEDDDLASGAGTAQKIIARKNTIPN
jgi:hypothetical protein